MATPIPATATPFAGTPGTDTVSPGSLHQTPRPRSSGCRAHVLSLVPGYGTVDNAKDGLALDHPAVPCTAGLSRGAGVASASDLQGRLLFPKWSMDSSGLRRLTLKYGALPPPILRLHPLIWKIQNVNT